MASLNAAQEKALRWISQRLRKIQRTLSSFPDVAGSQTKELKGEVDSLTIAKVAVQRQTATPAIQPEKHHDILACPRCGHYLDGKPFFCGYCGQHIRYGKADLSEFDIFEDQQIVRFVRERKDSKDTITVDMTNGATISFDISGVADIAENETRESAGICTIQYKNYH